MSQSARLLWVAARQNTDILPVPDPIPGMSEPHLATMLFEDSCLVGVVTHASPGVAANHAAGLRRSEKGGQKAVLVVP